jgi:hypothetical protein
MIIEHSKVYDLYMDTVLYENRIYSLKSAHDYSYENGSYSFKAKYTVIAEPIELQKTFMCSNCLTLRHYYSYDRYHRG